MSCEQIITSLRAVKQSLGSHKHTFELVGYDFMLVPTSGHVRRDEQDKTSHLGGQACRTPFEIRLIEVNTNPCLDESNALLKQLVPRMLDDMLKIVLDPLFGTAPQRQIVFPVEGYSDRENMWEPLINLNS